MRGPVPTEVEIKAGTWLREISSCSCLTVLPGPAWLLLSKTYKPLFPPLYGSYLLRLFGLLLLTKTTRCGSLATMSKYEVNAFRSLWSCSVS